MKKTFLLEDLDCAHCAAKIEEAVKNLEGVNDANVNFMTTKMVLNLNEEKDLDKTIKEIKKTVKKIEPDVTMKEL